MDIKPIETIYNGYRFRSRLEARWAVFFDAAGIEYEYEPEGFVLEYNIHYLPDFYLPTLDAYVEIKHGNLDEDALDEAENKCIWLHVQTEKVVLLCKGDPVDMNVTAFYSVYESPVDAWTPSMDSARFVTGARYWKSRLYDNGKPYIFEQYDDIKKVSIVIGDDDGNIADDCNPPTLIYKCLLRGQYSLFESERQKARQARFEHGETPKGKKRKTSSAKLTQDVFARELIKSESSI